MISDQTQLHEIMNTLVSQNVSRIRLGHGSFLTIDIGMLSTPVQTTVRTVGQWHLWVYMCAWRCDQEEKPFVASSDSREKIAECIQQLAGKTITKYEFLNASLDVKLYFDTAITVNFI